MAQLTLYHGSHYQFDRPDPRYFGVGDGQSVGGVGFYAAKYPEYAKEHVETRLREGWGPRDAGGVVYSMQVDIPDERVLNRYGSIDAQGVGRFAEQARLQGNQALADKLTELRRHVEIPRQNMYDNDRLNGDYMPVENGKLRMNNFYELVEKSENPTGAADFFRKSGIDAVLVPNNQYAHYVILNQDVIKGNMSVHEIVGNGPLRNNPSKLFDNREFFSEELHSAAADVDKIPDPNVRSHFRVLTETLLSDEYNRKGLDPLKDSLTSKQQDGFSLRDSLGHATQRLLRDGGMDDSHWSGNKTFERLREYAVRGYGEDDPLVKQIDRFQNSLNDHNQKIHGMDFSAKADVSAETPKLNLGSAFNGALSVAAVPLVAGYALYQGATPAQAAVEGAKTIDGVTSAVELYHGNVEGAIDAGKTDLAGIAGGIVGGAAGGLVAGLPGVIVGGIAGGVGGGLAADGLGLVGTVQHTPEQQALLDFYDSVPTEITADMPPEVQVLTGIKQGIVQKEQFLEQGRMASSGDMLAQRSLEDSIRTQMDESYEAFETEYHTLKESGALDAVKVHLDRKQFAEAPVAGVGGGAPAILRTAVHAAPVL